MFICHPLSSSLYNSLSVRFPFSLSPSLYLSLSLSPSVSLSLPLSLSLSLSLSLPSLFRSLSAFSYFFYSLSPFSLPLSPSLSFSLCLFPYTRWWSGFYSSKTCQIYPTQPIPQPYLPLLLQEVTNFTDNAAFDLHQCKSNWRVTTVLPRSRLSESPSVHFGLHENHRPGSYPYYS